MVLAFRFGSIFEQRQKVPEASQLTSSKAMSLKMKHFLATTTSSTIFQNVTHILKKFCGSNQGKKNWQTISTLGFLFVLHLKSHYSRKKGDIFSSNRHTHSFILRKSEIIESIFWSFFGFNQCWLYFWANFWIPSKTCCPTSIICLILLDCSSGSVASSVASPLGHKAVAMDTIREDQF